MNNNPEWMDVQVAPGQRGLPVYLLLDTSGSMAGAPIQSLQSAFEYFQQEILEEEFLRSSTRVGIITFNTEAELITNGLVSADELQPPTLEANGWTRLDLAFRCLLESLDRDVTKPVKGGQKGDYKPIVFVLTDGAPTDEKGNLTDNLWKPAREEVLERPRGKTKPANIIVVGCGPNVDDANLKAISTGVAIKQGNDYYSYKSFFQYVTQTMTATLQTGGADENIGANLSLPAGLVRL